MSHFLFSPFKIYRKNDHAKESISIFSNSTVYSISFLLSVAAK
jgi:hypothetical protein